MNILKLQGLDGRLFDLVAPLVMNPAVLRQNNNYPFMSGTLPWMSKGCWDSCP